MKQLFHEWRAVWRLPDARMVLVGGTAAVVALGLMVVTLLLRVHESGAGPLGATGLLLCISVPTILTMGVAGSLSDRYDARLLLAAGGLAQALALVGLALREELATTYVLTALGMLAGALAAPVWTAVLPTLAGEERSATLISLQQGLRAIAMPTGAGLAGVFVGSWGQPPALLLAALLAALSGLLPLGMRASHGGVDADRSSVELLPVSALAALRKHPVAYVLVLSLLPFVVAAEAVNAVEVFLVRDDLGASPTAFGLAAGVTGAGSALGAFAAGAIRPGRRVPIALTTLLLFSFTQVGQGLSPTFAVFLGLGLLGGLTVGLANAVIFVVILEQSPASFRGRVIALVTGLARTASLGATALGGSLATLMGARPAFVIAGVLGVVTALSAAAALRRHRTSGADAAQERQRTPRRALRR